MTQIGRLSLLLALFFRYLKLLADFHGLKQLHWIWRWRQSVDTYGFLGIPF